MKKSVVVVLMVLAVVSFAAAQIGAPASDVLGAHLNYGRGCAACHAPHSGAWGNGANKSGDSLAGTSILWGQDVGNLYGKTIVTGSTNGSTGYTEVLPASLAAGTPDVNGLLTCLSCHDGNWATGAMMKNYIYETVPGTYGTWNSIPTLLGNNHDASPATDYLSTHPVGLTAAVGCGGVDANAIPNWDCTETNGVITMNGANSSVFVTNYGFFVQLSAYNNTAVVTCTTCHNQHLMNVVAVTSASTSGLPNGNYATMFFVRGPYNPASGTAGSNQTAQFCRECHGGTANEMNGGLKIATVF